MRLPLDNPPKPSNIFGVPDTNAKFGKHAGIDYPVATGTPVYAPITGFLIAGFNDKYHGNYVNIEASGKWYRMMHLSSIPNAATRKVNEGELVGYSGNTGLSTGPHLHYDVRTQYNPTSFAAFVDPLTLIGGDVTTEDQVRFSMLGVTGGAMPKDQYEKEVEYWTGRDNTEFAKYLNRLGDYFMLAKIRENEVLKAENARLKADVTELKPGTYIVKG